ncbi:unnamed protein product [Coffea canephora]|uniref:Uncharacterized protein n=1 Tax=Coffea canephora TaxID=49390 RepID=A0A068UXP9_COFCA|nr:unnamed protein product [Coffea canephora]
MTPKALTFGYLSCRIGFSQRTAIASLLYWFLAVSSLKGRKNTFEKIEEAIDYVNEQLPSDDSSVPAAPDPNLKNATDRNEAQIPSELITQCVATLLMIQSSIAEMYREAVSTSRCGSNIGFCSYKLEALLPTKPSSLYRNTEVHGNCQEPNIGAYTYLANKTWKFFFFLVCNVDN